MSQGDPCVETETSCVDLDRFNPAIGFLYMNFYLRNLNMDIFSEVHPSFLPPSLPPSPPPASLITILTASFLSLSLFFFLSFILY